MAQQQIINGVVYQPTADGKWQVVGYADQPTPSSGFVPTGPADPTLAYKGPTAAIDLAKARADAATAAAQAPYAGSIAQANAAKAQSDAAIAAANARAAAAKEAAAPDPAAAKAQSDLGLGDMMTAIGNARNDIAAGYDTGNFFGGPIFANIPFVGQNATDLASALNTIGSKTVLDKLQQMREQSATGASGLGRLTNMEAGFLRDSIASLNQKQDKDRLLDNLANVELHYRRLNALSNGENPDDPAVAKKYGIAAVTPNAIGSGSPPSGGSGPGNTPPGTPPTSPPSIPPTGMGLSQSGYETVADPTLQGVNAKVASMIGSGKSAADVRAYLNQIKPGLGNALYIDDWVRFHAQHPNVPVSVSLETKDVPLSPVRSMVNSAAQSPIGAGAMSTADALTAGYLDNLTSNPALARAGMQAVENQHPIANIVGQGVGGTLAGLGAEGALAPALARIGIGGVGALRGADALYGGLYGSGSDDNNRLAGAALGATAGLTGGMFGRRLASTAGRSLAGIKDAGLQYLNNAGIPLTIGQTLGGVAKDFEDKATSIPFVGNLINARRGAGLQAFQRAAFDEALSPIGASTNGIIGAQGIAQGLDHVGNAYDQTLGGQAFTPDAQFKQGNGQISRQVMNIPRVGPELHSALDQAVTPLFENGVMSGRNMQAADRSLQQLKSSYSNDPLFHTHIAPAIDAVSDNLAGLVQRQAPDVLPAYANAKQAYRNMSVLADAVNAALNNKEGDEFTAAQLGQQARKNAIRFGSRNAAASGNRPFADLQRYAQMNLPSKVPDSGTAGRYALIAGASGLGGLGGSQTGEDGEHGSNAALGALMLGSLAAAPYSRPVQAAMTKALIAERPMIFDKAGNLILDGFKVGSRQIKPVKLAGMFANPNAVQYMTTGQ